MAIARIGASISRLTKLEEKDNSDNYCEIYAEFMRDFGKAIEAELMSRIVYEMTKNPEDYICGMVDGNATYIEFTLTAERKDR
jgi:hypothetical protein